MPLKGLKPANQTIILHVCILLTAGSSDNSLERNHPITFPQSLTNVTITLDIML